MGLPSVDIAFRTAAASAIQRSQKGVVALILKDSKQNGALHMTNVTQVPTALGKGNQEYIQRAFTGYVTPPRAVLAYVLPSAAVDLTEALQWLATQVFDYLAGPPDIAEADCAAITAWVNSRRLNDRAICKAVLPNTAADSEAVVSLTTEEIKVGSASFTPGQFCSRMAGLLAGTPMTIACTYATLPEVSDVKRMTRREMDDDIDAGKLILFHDGEKVKVGRGVNTLQTTTQDKGETFKKIKVVEALDMIQSDVRMTMQDAYIGRYANSYDNKCLLIMAIKGYLTSLELAGILQAGSTWVGIDIPTQEVYLQGVGTDTSKMSEQQIKEANTGAKVFLAAKLKVLDAIEDISVQITI